MKLSSIRRLWIIIIIIIIIIIVGLPREWAGLYSLPVSATFSIAQMGLTVGIKCAEEWCKRMQFWYSIWKLQDKRDYRYTDKYRPDEAWSTYAASVLSGTYAGQRVEVIECIIPTNF